VSIRNRTFSRGFMKPLLAAVALALVAVACSESVLPTETEFGLQPRFEIGVQEGSCPTPFTLAGGIAIDPDLRFDPEVDRNRDGFACYLETHVAENEVFRTWTDNNIPFSQIGGCPNSFDLILINWETIGRTSDLNGDGRVCTRVGGNGSTIVIDNNHRA
jgi:hypothetical protein